MKRPGNAPVALEAAPSFPGDPGDGNFMIGWALESGTWDLGGGSTNVKTNPGWPGDPVVSFLHDYSGNEWLNTTRMNNIANNVGDFFPSMTFKGPSAVQSESGMNAIVAGSYDANIDAMAAACDALWPKPVWMNFFHEPEDNITGAGYQTAYRAAFRYIVLRFRSLGITNVAWMPIYMSPYTFEAGSGRDWRVWHPDWNGSGWHSTLVTDFIGIDVYNPLPGGTTSRTFQNMIDVTFAKTKASGVPPWDYVIPEFGFSDVATPTPDWTSWNTEARDVAISENIKAFTYWDNSNVPVGRYSFGPTYDPTGEREAGWNVLTDASVRMTY